MGVRQKNISGIFRRFLFSFLLAGAATILVLGVIVQILTIKAVIHPANYDEQQLEQKREEIQEAEKVEERMLPYGTRFGVFDNSGRWLYGTFTESEREEVWKAVLEEKNEIRSGYLKRFQREEEICLVSYQLRVQFGNPALRERFPHVLELLLLAALLIFCAEVMFLIRYFSRKIKQELQKIEWMTEKIEHQDLEFPCPDSQVLEIKKILETFGRMRDTLKESLMKQWELESARKEQMGALAHDLKTPLTVIRGNVQLMGEAESLEEAQKYSLALEQEIQGIEEYLQILQEMISTGGYQMYKKEQVDIRELTGQFRERIEAAAAGKKQTIQFECENLPKWICVNEKLLIRSWENLVYNAIEYTPQGGMIRICISEGKEQLEISVEDEGERIFGGRSAVCEKPVLSGRQKQTFQETLRDGIVSGRAICKRKRRKSYIGQLYEDERSMGKTADCERIPEISNCKSLKKDIEYKRNLIRKERKTDRCYLYTIRNVPHANVPKSGWMSIRFLMKNEISKRITRHWKS